MQVAYREKSGAGWWRRCLAALSLLAGIAAAWCWLDWQAPLYSASLTILVAPEKLAETEETIAKTLRNSEFKNAVSDAAEQMVAAEQQLSFLHRHWRYSQTLPVEQWETFVLNNLRQEVLDDRQYRLSLTYACFGKPTHTTILQQLALMLAMESERAVNSESERERSEHSAALAQIDREIQRLQPEQNWHSHRAQAETVLAMLAQASRGEPPTVAWQNAWRDFPEVNAYLSAISQSWTAWQNAATAVDQRRMEAEKLSEWIAKPQNQTVSQIFKRVVYHEDSPELIRLKDKRAEIEAARMRLLLRATPLHPLAKKMAAEIIELNAQINALTRLPQEVEDVEVRTNPQLPIWQRELTSAQSALRAAEIAERAANADRLAAIAALKKADVEALATRADAARKEILNRREQFAAKEFASPSAPFSIYAEPIIHPLDPKDYYLTYAVGAFIGIALALLWLPGRRRTDFSYADPPPPPPTYPVLGAIPDFRLSEKSATISS